MFGSESDGLFDFNGDGEVSFSENFLAYNIFEEITNANSDKSSSYCDDDDDEYDDDDPDAADIDEDDDDEGDDDDDGRIDPDDLNEDDYPNKRSYDAACCLAYYAYYCDEDYKFDLDEKKEMERCHFILEKADTILAAKYCTNKEGFLYAQAVKDHFKLPVSLPDEDEFQEYNVCEIITKIGRKDVGLALRVWHWLVDQFLPYARYSLYAQDELTYDVINSLYEMSDKLIDGVVDYLYDHMDFCEKIMMAHKKIPYYFGDLIFTCMEQDRWELATNLYLHGLRLANDKWREINSLTDKIIKECRTYDETETMKYFYERMFPFVRSIDIGMVKDEVEVWEEEIQEYLGCTNRGEEEDDEDEDEEDEEYEDEDEDEDDPASVLAPIISQIMEIYTICGVALEDVSRVYHYKSGDLCLQIGDTVRVPAGKNELTGTVVSVGQYMGWAAPFPVEKMKTIIKKMEE